MWWLLDPRAQVLRKRRKPAGELAGQGHAGAQMIMDGLQKQGIGFAPESAAPAKPETKTVK